jgi:hypothetical protein
MVCGEPRDCDTPKMASSTGTMYELLFAFPFEDEDEAVKLLVVVA